MKNIKTILCTALLSLLLVNNIYGQGVNKITGKILSELNKPIEGAIVMMPGAKNVTTGADGVFHFELKDPAQNISVWAAGYFPVSQLVNGRTDIQIMMIPETQYRYNESSVLPFQIENKRPELTSAVNIAKKDLLLGETKIDRALSGQIAGLLVTRNGGMPGEGSYMNIRGIRSFVGGNEPLIVINNVPYLPDTKESQLINGFTRNVFQSYNLGDIQNITVLKGAEASMYGSLGSNGVILIETDGANSDDLDTKVSFNGQYGVSWNNKRMPLLEGTAYKSYLTDMGMTYYNNMQSFFSEFPFLNNPNSKYSYLYNNNTDWQDEIYKNGFVTDNLFRVEGGDAIAKYDLSLGYSMEDGILNNANSQRYHTQLNTNVLISKKFEMFATIGMAFLEGNYQEQGMDSRTNPVLAAYAKSPLLSPYEKDINGKTLSTYEKYYYGSSEVCNNMDFATSNPIAIVNTLDANNRQYDVNARTGLTYKALPELIFTGTIGLYYNYNNEHLFVPGLTDKSIVPFFDQYGEMKNSVKEGVGETFNMFYNITGQYKKIFNYDHALNVSAGAQVLMSKKEYDAGVGRNTSNDFYQVLGSSQTIGRYFFGYLEKWNWMNFYAHADYTFKEMIAASVNMAVDGASSSGTNADHFYTYPSVGLTWLGKGWLPLSNSTLVNRLNVRAEYGLSGNSRYSSNLGKYYYRSLPYKDISGIGRANIPNTQLKPEKNTQMDVGLDMGLFHNRLNITFDYYNSLASDVIFALPLSSEYGSGKYYDNCGEIENKGIELSLQASLVRTRDLEWIVGGSFAQNKSKVKSLGERDQIVLSYSDGAQIVTKVGEDPYQFYGYEAEGVFSTQAEATEANLVNKMGRAYQAGDVHFVDSYKDGRINESDRVTLGSATPDFFGGFFTQIRVKSFALSADFTYSKGNKAYNAVRQNLESLSSFNNQSLSVVNRWTLEGQVTDIPRAQWGDPVGNSVFSSRWIEDASYLKMKNITLSYTFNKKLFDFIRSGTIYVTGENLLTMTKYLGMDPEFSYSYGDAIQGFDYAKLMQPKAVKFGVNLKF